MDSKVRTREEIISRFRDGQVIAVGGQAGHNMPDRLIECVLESGAKHLTIYSIDSGNFDRSVGRLIHAGAVDRLVTTHVGTNPETSEKALAGELELVLCPMGNFIERIRCGGLGLGGVLTRTGLGTAAADGKQVIRIDGQDFLVEPALRADISITRARRADPIGNLTYRGTGTASHPVMAACGALSIVECDHFCDLGEIPPDDVKLPGIFVDMILV